MALRDEVFEHGPDPDNPGWRHWNLKDQSLFNGAVMGKLIPRVDDDGKARLRMFPERRHENLQGIVHGAVTLSLIDISLRAKGDTHIDFHHTTEDSGSALGQAVARSLGRSA